MIGHICVCVSLWLKNTFLIIILLLAGFVEPILPPKSVQPGLKPAIIPVFSSSNEYHQRISKPQENKFGRQKRINTPITQSRPVKPDLKPVTMFEFSLSVRSTSVFLKPPKTNLDVGSKCIGSNLQRKLIQPVRLGLEPYVLSETANQKDIKYFNSKLIKPN